MTKEEIAKFNEIAMQKRRTGADLQSSMSAIWTTLVSWTDTFVAYEMMTKEQQNELIQQMREALKPFYDGITTLSATPVHGNDDFLNMNEFIIQD